MIKGSVSRPKVQLADGGIQSRAEKRRWEERGGCKLTSSQSASIVTNHQVAS